MNSLNEEYDVPLLITKLRNNQIQECDNIISNIINYKVDQGLTRDELISAKKISEHIEKMETKTEKVLDDPDALRDVNLYIRRILLRIIQDLGYKEKVNPEEAETPDDISTLFFWYRTIVTANLDDKYESINHDYAIHALNDDRNDIEHGTEDNNIRSDTVGITILTWYALEEILQNYQASHTLAMLDNLNQLEQSNKSYGYIANLEKGRQTVVPFEDGIDGDHIEIDLETVRFYPNEGDPVQYNYSNSDQAEDLKKLF